MRILLINPWQKTLFGDGMAQPGHPHLGLAYLVGALKKHGETNIKIYDQGLEADEDHSILLDNIKNFRPEVIGVTTFSYCIDYAVELIDLMKKHTSVPIIIGGPHVSAVKSKILNETNADFGMYGESEITFPQFLVELNGSKQYESVNNLIWRNPEGEITMNPAEPDIKDVDAIPFPNLEAFEFERYSYASIKALPIITSRGCPYDCNFCSVRLSMGTAFRQRSPENVVQEMKHWIKLYGITRFEINDDVFSLNMKRAEAICDLIIKEKLNITFEMYNGIRADHVTERLLKKMKDAGCVFISYGCESGNQGIIKNMGKDLDIEKVREAVDLTSKLGVRNSVNFIIGHRGETYATGIETIEFAKSLNTDFVNFYNVIPYPGTELYDWVKRETKQLVPDNKYLSQVGSRDMEPIFETPEYPREERKKILKKGFDLYERSILTFRFGKLLGTFAYYVSRPRFLFTIGRKVALSTKLGFQLYSLITYKSRRSEKANPVNDAVLDRARQQGLGA